MADLLVAGVLFALILVVIVVPFVVVPEILERWGYDPKNPRVRLLVWACFLVLVLVPAALSGFLATVTNPADWMILAAAILVAFAWEYYRLHPERFA